jgi:hypothetical protein
MKTSNQNLGRLIVVAEPHLSEASRYALRQLVSEMIPEEDVTMLTSLGRMTTQEASLEGNGIFYNTDDHMPLDTACAMLPWREMWLVSNGRIWKATPFNAEDVLTND